MNRTPVKSSQLVSVGYDEAERILEVEFRGGGTYQYFGVGPEAHKALVEAESIGKYFGKNIRGQVEYKKLEPERK